MTKCNSTLTDERISHEAAIVGNIDFHHVGLIISAVFGLISIIISFFLIFQHATHYLKPWEQKHIIRILFMVPIYATVSFLSYLYYWHAVYYDVLEQCYEPFAIASFFTLMCVYIAPTLRDQKDYFRSLQPKNWFWGVFGLQYITGGQNKGPFRKPRSGLTWFNVRILCPPFLQRSIYWLGLHQKSPDNSRANTKLHRSSGLVFFSTASFECFSPSWPCSHRLAMCIAWTP